MRGAARNGPRSGRTTAATRFLLRRPHVSAAKPWLQEYRPEIKQGPMRYGVPLDLTFLLDALGEPDAKDKRAKTRSWLTSVRELVELGAQLPYAWTATRVRQVLRDLEAIELIGRRPAGDRHEFLLTVYDRRVREREQAEDRRLASVLRSLAA